MTVPDGRGGEHRRGVAAAGPSPDPAAGRGAARAATEAVVSRIGGIVAGLAAVVWEADARTWEFTFVSERAEQLLGFPAEQWLGDAGFWPRIIHPDDRDEALRTCAAGTASGRDYDFSYRALAADGRVVWLYDIVHVVSDPDGTPRELQGVLIDVTEEKRRERAAALLAEAGRLLAGAGTVDDRLTAVAGLAVGELCDLATVWLAGDGGRSRPVAGAPAESAARVLALAPVTVPAQLRAAQQAGRPYVVDDVPESLRRAGLAGDELAVAAGLGVRAALVAPLIADGQVVGSLNLAATGPRRGWDEADLAVVGDLAQRIAVMVAAERVAARQRLLQAITAALASAATLEHVARALMTGLAEAFGAAAQNFYVVEPGVEPGRERLRLVTAVGYPDRLTEKFRVIAGHERVPIAEAARSGQPVWVRDRDDWQVRYPHLVEAVAAGGNQAAVALPLRVAGRVVAVLAASFPTAREFPADEREFALTLVGQAAQAVARAIDADRRRSVAEILQHALLPPVLPQLGRLALATHYQPAAGGEAGGDWYDVLALDEDRVAVVVGDVVGQGPGAAAVMGQLRSALAAYLLDGHSPAEALQRLNRFAARIDGARASTAACVVLDTRAERVCWAGAGHPPPLLVDAGGPRYLDDACGPVLGVAGTAPHTEEQVAVAAGVSLVLYTDGLVERRGETIDEGLARLADAVRAQPGAAPTALISAVLDHNLAGRVAGDDVAILVARLRPAPLERRVPAVPVELSRMRRAVHAWATAAALPDEVTDDLQFALGEAVANSVEHAYPDGAPGRVAYHLDQDADGSVRVDVHDEGTWRPVPPDPGFRGRGLQVIHALGRQVTIDHRGPGTRVRFTIPTLAPPAGSSAVAAAGRGARRSPLPPVARPAELQVQPAVDGRVPLRLRGELDHAALPAVRVALLEQLHASDQPMTLDTREVSYLSSAGVALLAEAADAARGRLCLLVDPDSAVGRILALTGLDRAVPTGP